MDAASYRNVIHMSIKEESCAEISMLKNATPGSKSSGLHSDSAGASGSYDDS